MNILFRLLLLTLLLDGWGTAVSAQTTITIPQDPAIGQLQQQQQQQQTLQQTIEQAIQTLQTEMKALQTPPPPPPPPRPALPALEQFNGLMLDATANTATAQGSYGGGWWCSQYKNYPDPGALFQSDLTYYDAARVFYQIAAYTKDLKWTTCAKAAVKAYMTYVNHDPAKPGAVAGYILFPKGLYLDWLNTGDPASKQAVIDMATNAAFSNTPFPSWLPGPATIREMAYNLEAKLYANDLGQSLDYSFILGRLKLYFQQSLYMLQHQTATGMPAPDPVGPGDVYVRPFMIGLGAEALIEYASRTKDASVLGLIQPVLDLMWQQAYDGKGAMLYTVPQANGACPWTADNSDQCDTKLNGQQFVLNMLIAPAYAWVYAQTGDVAWRDRADTLFTGVVTASYQTGFLCCPQGKAFNQVMRWFPEYLAWRNGP